MANPFSLPFQFNNQSISEWLGHFKSAGVIVTGQEINGVLTVLNREHAKIEVPLLQLVLMRLTPVVLYLAEFLQKTIITKPQQAKTAQMSCHILQCMAFLHGYLAKQVTDNSQKVLHANYALQITGIAFQHYAISYERPPGELWEGMSKCYQLALHANLLDVPVEKPLPGLQVVATIALALKRNLLFCLASPYRFKQQKFNSYLHFVPSTVSWLLLCNLARQWSMCFVGITKLLIVSSLFMLSQSSCLKSLFCFMLMTYCKRNRRRSPPILMGSN